MKNKLKTLSKFAAILLALLAAGMHVGAVAVPMLAGYKFNVLLVAFVLLSASILL